VLELKVHDGDREVVLKLEHSLLSLSKWESRTKTPFLTERTKQPIEMVDYFRDMVVSPEEDADLVYTFTPDQLEVVTNYINEPQTASTVPEQKKEYNPEVVTSELVYHWLVAMRIPFHPVETWHLSRAVMLVQIHAYKMKPEKKQKRSTLDTMTEWIRQNETNKKILGIKDGKEEA
jgi:hypothetical protein